MGNFEVALHRVATITMGTSPKGTTYNHERIGLPLLNGPTEFGETYPHCTLYTTDSKKECKAGDLIFCVRGSTTGRMNWSNRLYSLGRGLCSIRGETPLDTKFIRCCIEWKLNELLNLAGGSTFPNLTRDAIRNFPIPYPESRHKIAAALSAYDDLIENNTRRIKILEEMASAIYREWFVEFRFPGHEQVEQVESELGLIPQGAEVKSFGEVSFNFDRQRKPLSGMVRSAMQGEYPYYGAAKIFDHVNDYLFDGRYLLIAEDGSVITEDGKPVLQLVTGKFWVNNHAHVIQGKSPISTNFIYLFMSNVAISGYITGAAQPKINQNNLNRIPILSPPQDLLERFDKMIGPIFDNIATLDLKNINLRQTRDLLLPKLISGEIDVSELDINID